MRFVATLGRRPGHAEARVGERRVVVRRRACWWRGARAARRPACRSNCCPFCVAARRWRYRRGLWLAAMASRAARSWRAAHWPWTLFWWFFFAAPQPAREHSGRRCGLCLARALPRQTPVAAVISVRQKTPAKNNHSGRKILALIRDGVATLNRAVGRACGVLRRVQKSVSEEQVEADVRAMANK